VSKLPALLTLLALATLPLALGCSSSTCSPIPDGVYTAIGLDGGPLTMLTGSDADAGDAGATDAGTTEVPVTYTFQHGLPAPYDSWTCDQPAMTCEMAYLCTGPNGYQMAGVVTSYTPGQRLAFSVTFPGSPGTPGTIVNLDPHAN
jgi:hypothetical protein